VSVDEGPADWEQQPDESAKAYAAFSAYRSQGSARSLRSVADQLGKSLSLLNRWSTQWNWGRRVAAYDRHMDRVQLIEEEEARREMAQRHARTAQALMTTVARRVIGDEAHGIAALDPNTLNGTSLARLLEVAVRIERQSRGEPGQVDRVDTTVDLAESDRALIDKLSTFGERKARRDNGDG